MSLLSDKVAESQFTGLPEWQVANLLNQPDNSLPVIVSWSETRLGIADVANAMGIDRATIALETLSTLAATQAAIKWSMKVLGDKDLNLAYSSTRDFIGFLTQEPISLLTAEEANAILALSKKERYPSWAEYNNVAVDARAVSLARGGV
jgi:hypothetical protein